MIIADGSESYMFAPMYNFSSSYPKKTSVFSVPGAPSFGCACTKSVIGVSVAQSASSRRPSIWIPEMRFAVISGRGRDSSSDGID